MRVKSIESLFIELVLTQSGESSSATTASYGCRRGALTILQGLAFPKFEPALPRIRFLRTATYRHNGAPSLLPERWRRSSV
ncbi:hypothetical protein PsYK624_039540 [Phanerochaete sordida]|uniref:Uncharacterized protein n=1 Tax=Phanerochaete sordida TaxID=48140 RepID=A0A9P3G5D4_9APHY|nr:hypothetical protein PsYK624_039540 [Phanerochaete sordida]